MTIESLKFEASDFTATGASSLPDRPKDAGMTATQVKAALDNIAKVMIALGSFNDLIDALLATTTGDSGAANIGSEAISGVTGATVRAQLANLKTQLDNAILGEFTEGSITESMLATDFVTKVNGKDDKEIEILTVTASKTLATTDLNVLQNCTHASVAIVSTVPIGLWSYKIPIPFKRGGAADASVLAGAGVTINQTKLKIANQYDYAALIPTETSETYDFIGTTKV